MIVRLQRNEIDLLLNETPCDLNPAAQQRSPARSNPLRIIRTRGRILPSH